MQTFLFIYHGTDRPKNAEEGQKLIKDWSAWFKSMGDALVDEGHPVGKSVTLLSDGSVQDHGGSNPVSGYSIVQAEDLNGALALAMGCPLMGDHSIEIAPIMQMPSA